jgi:peptide-methionine (S)-S-oxide reductase
VARDESASVSSEDGAKGAAKSLWRSPNIEAALDLKVELFWQDMLAAIAKAPRKFPGERGTQVRPFAKSTQKSNWWQTSSMTSETTYFATGCFWGAERRFWQMPGVVATSVGYMGGEVADPFYELVCTGKTGHAEIVEVTFNPTLISYQDLLKEFWTMHDPTTLNRQGNDVGSQYRSAIFTTSPDQLAEAKESAAIYQGALKIAGVGLITTQIREADGMTYWLAEDYHQQYLKKNPRGYDCHSSTGIPFPSEVSA